jgi:flavorubredoxin
VDTRGAGKEPIVATIDEVSQDIYRINIEIPQSPVTFSFFLIKDEQPALVETGFGKLFDESLEAVKRLVDVSKLRYVVAPHFEGDECGALNHFLGVAPHAQAVCSPVGAITSFSDFPIREALPVDEDTVLDLGRHRLRFLITPYVHQWESMLAWEEATRTVFTSDVFIQPGPRAALTYEDLTEEMIATYQQIGIFPSRAHLDNALSKIEAVQPRTLAAHHGSVVGGNIDAYIRALRVHDVTGVTEWNPMKEGASQQPAA